MPQRLTDEEKLRLPVSNTTAEALMLRAGDAFTTYVGYLKEDEDEEDQCPSSLTVNDVVDHIESSYSTARYNIPMTLKGVLDPMTFSDHLRDQTTGVCEIETPISQDQLLHFKSQLVDIAQTHWPKPMATNSEIEAAQVACILKMWGLFDELTNGATPDPRLGEEGVYN